jgi:hypothetical protein
LVVPVVIAADIDEANESAKFGLRHLEGCGDVRAIQLPILLLAINVDPIVPVIRDLRDPRLGV